MQQLPTNNNNPEHDNANEFLLEVFLGEDTYNKFAKLRNNIEELSDSVAKRLIELERKREMEGGK